MPSKIKNCLLNLQITDDNDDGDNTFAYPVLLCFSYLLLEHSIR